VSHSSLRERRGLGGWPSLPMANRTMEQHSTRSQYQCRAGEHHCDDGVSQKTSIWRALGSRLRSKTVQFRQARRELPHNFRGAESACLKFSMSVINRLLARVDTRGSYLALD